MPRSSFGRITFAIVLAASLQAVVTGVAWGQRSNRTEDAPVQVRIDPELVGAKIRIDGKVVADPDVTSLLLSPGPHVIHLSKGGLAVQLPITVVEGETSHLQPVLTPQDAGIRVDSTPDGATVKVDGRQVGRTPLALKLPAGTHHVEVDHPKMPTASTDVELDAGWDTAVRVDLGLVAAKSEFLHASTWNWQRRTAMIAGAVLLVYGFTEVDQLNQSNNRQSRLKDDAVHATTQQSYDDTLAQIKKERENGLQHEQNAQLGYLLAAAALGLAIYFDGPRDSTATRNSRIEVTAAPGPNGTPMVALKLDF